MEQAGERVLVGPAVHVLALDLLGGDVGRRAEREAGVEAGRLVGQPPRQAEVGEIRVLALVEQHVGGLDVAVHEPARVGCVQGIGDLRADGDRARRLERALARSAAA